MLRGAAWCGMVRQGYLIKIMAGITTSETLAGEQPKNDDLLRKINEVGGRLAELIVKNREIELAMTQLNEEYARLKEAYGRQT